MVPTHRVCAPFRHSRTGRAIANQQIHLVGRGEGGPLPRGRETWPAYHSVEDRRHSCIDGAGYVSMRSTPKISRLPSTGSVFGLIAKRTEPWTHGESLPRSRRVY